MSNKYPQDPSTMSRTMLQSELNALNYLDKWTLEDYAYRDSLEAELIKRIKNECQNDTEDV